ncbi:helix-turn-helix domain-containing protein [Subdoligranulum variabile]|uniref:helix-turn-helix domain-containing protein n=1 Tax=Subdoligranulum variabile TaxID=214851 RepID=UPI00241626AC|nr:helix-turn-helix domain-containing protein [Subdoligranulum variabile]
MDRICEALDCQVEDVLEYIPNKQKRTGNCLILEEHGNPRDNETGKGRLRRL